jgi:hypothetical protein
MNTITVAATPNDPRMFSVKKFSNAPGLKFLRKTEPDVSALSTLAKFLVSAIQWDVSGVHIQSNYAHRVKCFNGKTEAQTLRNEAKLGLCRGTLYTKTRKGVRSPNVAKATRMAKNYIKCYDLKTVPTQIDDWLFDVIHPTQTDAGYWNLQAEKMLTSGVIRIKIGTSEWRKS